MKYLWYFSNIYFVNIGFLAVYSIALEKGNNKPPNIIVIVADDLGWNDVSFHGSPQIPTPNIDAWAADGVKLNNYYVQPVCSPSRAALLTGRYPSRYGLQRFIVAGQRLGLMLNETIWPQYLTLNRSGLNYKSHAVGKWHLGFFNKKYTPTQRGFNTFYGYYNGKNDYYDHRDYESSNAWWALDWHEDNTTTFSHVTDEFGQYSTDLLCKRAMKIIYRHASLTKVKRAKNELESNLFLYLSFQSVHSANSEDLLQAPLENTYRHSNIWSHHRRTYAGMVSSMDDAIGQIRTTLRRTGMDQNTIVLFTSDNGGPAHGFDGNFANNWPLRGVKATLYEGGIKAAAFIAGPGLPKGTISNEIMHIVDWLPTFVEAASADVSLLANSIDGISQWNSLTKGDKGPRKEVLFHLDSTLTPESFALRRDDFKLLGNPDNGYPGWHSWYAPSGSLPNTTYIVPVDPLNPTQVVCDIPAEAPPCFSRSRNQSICLFNIKTDPCEKNNLVDEDEHKAIVEQLLLRLLELKRGMLPAFNPKIDPLADPRLRGYKWESWTNSTRIET